MNAPPPNPLDPNAPSPTPFKISPDDQRILQECNREAFFVRCLPFSTLLGTLAYLASKAGYLNSHATWGATPKVVGAAFLGYFIGKISYQQVCAEKLMANPNSQLGAVLRARRRQGGGGFQDTLALDLPGYTLPTGENAVDTYREDFGRGTFTDLDTDRPANHELNDSFRPNLDSLQRPEDFILPPQAQTSNSYEEMRRMNREEYEAKMRSNRTPEEPVRTYQPARPAASEPFDRYKSTNAYGDIFEK